MFTRDFMSKFTGKLVLLRCISGAGDSKESYYYSGMLELVPQSLMEGPIIRLIPIKDAEKSKRSELQQMISGNTALVPKVTYIPIETIVAMADLQDTTESVIDESY